MKKHIINILSFIFLSLLPLTANAQSNLKGDVNGDGIINAADLVEMIGAINGKESSTFNMENADMNKDGIVDRNDVEELAKLIMTQKSNKVEGNYIFSNPDNKEWGDEANLVTMSKDGATITIVNDKGENAVLMLDFASHLSLLMCPTNDGVLITPYDPVNDKAGDNIICLQDHGDQIATGVVHEDEEDHSIVCDSICLISDAIIGYHHAPQRAQRQAQSFRSAEQIAGNYLGDVYGYYSKNISPFGKMAGVLEKGFKNGDAKASDIVGMQSKMFDSSSKYWYGVANGETTVGDMSDLGEELVDIGEKSVLKSLIGDNNNAGIIKDLLSIIVNKTDLPWDDIWKWGNKKKDEREEGFPIYMGTTNPKAEEAIRNTWNQRQRLLTMPIPDLTKQPNYHVEVKVSDITSTAVTLSGSYKEIYPGASIVQMGYLLKGPDGERFIESWDLQTTRISDLKPNSQYKVYARLSSASGYFLSKTVIFTTEKERFKLSTTEVEFDVDGGEEFVKVEASKGIEWNISDKPSWTTVKKASDGFTISVGETENEREGKIIISVTYSNGKSEDFTVYVYQDGEYVIPDIDADFIFEGDMESTENYTHWLDGEETTRQENDTGPIIFGLTRDGDHVNLVFPYGDGETVTVDLSDAEKAIIPFLGHPVDGKRYQDGWRCEMDDHSLSVTNNSITFTWKVSGDLDYDKTTKTDGYTSHNTGNGSMTFSGSITINGLLTNSPTMEYKDYREQQATYTQQIDYNANIAPINHEERTHLKESNVANLTGYRNY